MSHCSEANRVPVRPKPVATSSAMTSTPARLRGLDDPAHRRGLGDLDAGRALHQRLEHDGRQLVGVARRSGSTAGSAQSGSS